MWQQWEQHKTPTTQCHCFCATAEPAIFAGCSIVCWERAHTSQLMSRATAMGAVEENVVGPHTTHVIAKYVGGCGVPDTPL